MTPPTDEARCDRIVNNGMGEPAECGRTLPCEYHDPDEARAEPYPDRDNWITKAKKAHRRFVLAVDAKRTRHARALDAWARKWEELKRLGRLR